MLVYNSKIDHHGLSPYDRKEGDDPKDRHWNPYSFDFVTKRLAVGGFILDTTDAEVILSKGITHIINCGQVKEDEYFSSGFPILHCPTKDDAQEKPPEWFKRGLDFALDVLRQPRTKLYVHCHTGIHRGPSMTYCILRALGLNEGLARTLIATARPIAKNFLYRQDANRAIKELGYE